MSRILIVEDDFTIKLELEEMLTTIGYDIVGTAGNGEQAVEMAKTLNPDLILMDIVMPGDMDGISAAEKIRQESDIPIVFITGYGDPEYVERAKQVEPFGYVMKPFDEKEISAVVEIALYKREMELKLKEAQEQLEHSNRDLQKEIRDRRKTQEALFESEARYRQLLNTAPAGIYEVDFIKQKFTNVNDAICEYTGYTREELLSMSPFDILTEDAKKLFGERLGKLFSGKKVPDTAEFKALRKDGTEFWALLNVTYLYENEKLKGAKVVAYDITDRKQAEEALRESEERFRTVADFAYDCEYWVAPDDRYIYVSPSCERITGYSPKDFLNDHRLLEKIVHPDDQSTFLNHTCQEKEQKGTVSFDFRIITRSGKERWISHACQPVYGSKGEYLGQRACNRDISKRKLIEKELQQSQKMEAIGTLTGGIAHDYNNLMSIIMGNLSIAMEDAEPGSVQADCLNEINIASKKVRDLTHELMSLSRGGAPVKEVLSLTGLLEIASSVVAADGRTSLKESISQDLWQVPYDPYKMGAVFRNLVTNALEAMPKGGVITITAENLRIEDKEQYPGLTLNPGDYVQISIQDKGMGIPEEHLNKIFDPYFSTKAMGVQKGMGLGLATAYAIVQKHDGHIQIDSSPGTGTTVNIYLPAKSQPEQMDRTIISADNKTSPVNRVLVMDDEEMLRELTRQMLERMGYAVQTVEDGLEAIEKYKQKKDSSEPFDAVILDLTIKGGMGGEQTMQELLKIDPGVKAIVSSGYFNDPVMSNFKKYGFMGALPKPYANKTLKEVLEKLSE